MLKRKLSRTIGASLASLSLAFIGLSSIPHSANAQVGTVDEVERILSHFLCYEAQAQSPPGLALLQDQFDRLDNPNAFDLAFVLSPIRFCNPVEKRVSTPTGVIVTPIVNPQNHLAIHFQLTLPPGPDREVVINNQFGEQRIKVLDWSFLLAVPTWKNRIGDEPSGIDHFKCHFVTSAQPVDRSVRLFDQFFLDGVATRVGQPQLLCNPTRKIHGTGSVGIFELDAHLACYAIEPTPAGPPIRIDNQFVEAAPMDLGRGIGLCVPSLKRVVGNQLPDLIPVPDATTQSFCRRPAGSVDLLVEVQNVGAGNAGPSRVTVDFGIFGQQTAGIAGLAPGASDRVAVPIPLRCFDPNCEFRIIADDGDIIIESDEINNFASDVCLG